jgi:hypothetical protein
MRELLIRKINQSLWWHVPPSDNNAYKKRGKFLASSYLQAEFYGLPNIDGEKVQIQNPVFGFSEPEIFEQLFQGDELEAGYSVFQDLLNGCADLYKKRIALDAKMFEKAKELGFDAIVLMTEAGKKSLQLGQKPRSIELNLVK